MAINTQAIFPLLSFFQAINDQDLIPLAPKKDFPESLNSWNVGGEEIVLERNGSL